MSSDSRVTVVRIESMTPHPNADTLSVATVLGDGTDGSGYPVVVKTSDYRVGDLALYVPVDMVCPDQPAFAFLGSREKDRRVKAKRLRGVFSMGLLVPVDALLGSVRKDTGETITSFAHGLGLDLTDALGFTKYEPEPMTRRSTCGPGGKYLPGDTEHGVSDAIAPKYTDIENVRRWPKALDEGEEVILTEKVHGANARFVFANERLYVGSHRRFIKPDTDGLWPDLARKYHLDKALSVFPGLVLYGEAYGYVQDLRYGLGEDTALVAFDIYDTNRGQYLDYDVFTDLIMALNMILRGEARNKGETWPELTTAPVLYRGPWKGLSGHKDLAEGPSVIGNGQCIREGWVVRPAKECQTKDLGRTILKFVGEDFLTRGQK